MEEMASEAVSSTPDDTALRRSKGDLSPPHTATLVEVLLLLLILKN